MAKLNDAMYEALCRIYSETVTHGQKWAYSVHNGSANALVRRGLAEVEYWGFGIEKRGAYRLTDAGRAALAEAGEGE